ncbi:hypothetical protein BASA81_017287 [Batrachochytrium salamandrivorans]|nr:hypothetical protein BASA81_017287 [Batrachochytrium salamandrivorans]
MERQTRSQWCLHSPYREDGEVFSSEEGDRSVRATPKKARDASPPPRTICGWFVKNLSQQVAAQQAELDALRNAFALQQKATAELIDQMKSTGEATQAALAAILARLEVGPVLVERQPDFRKAGAAAWLALKRETSVPAHSAPKVELSSGLRLIYASGFPYAKPGDLRRNAGARIRTSAMEHVSKIDRRTTKHGARFRITVPEDRQRTSFQRLERQSKQTHWRIRQNYRHRRPDQPRPTAPPPPLSRQILAVNVANISNKRPAIRHIVRNTRLWAISETCITSSKFAYCPGFDVIQHPATGPGRRGIALGIPSCFGGHEHDQLDSAQSMVDVIRQLTTLCCNAPARALLTSPRVDRQTAVADHFVIRTSIRAEAQGQPPVPRAPTISRHHCLEATDRIATSNYWMC